MILIMIALTDADHWKQETFLNSWLYLTGDEMIVIIPNDDDYCHKWKSKQLSCNELSCYSLYVFCAYLNISY